MELIDLEDETFGVGRNFFAKSPAKNTSKEGEGRDQDLEE